MRCPATDIYPLVMLGAYPLPKLVRLLAGGLEDFLTAKRLPPSSILSAEATIDFFVEAVDLFDIIGASRFVLDGLFLR